jgi:hypothetical protein
MGRPKNLDEPTVDVKHSELKRFGQSMYTSECPKCKGLLLVGRDSTTFELQEYDRCVLCGQKYRYLDIKDLRKKEGISSYPALKIL